MKKEEKKHNSKISKTPLQTKIFQKKNNHSFFLNRKEISLILPKEKKDEDRKNFFFKKSNPFHYRKDFPYITTQLRVQNTSENNKSKSINTKASQSKSLLNSQLQYYSNKGVKNNISFYKNQTQNQSSQNIPQQTSSSSSIFNLSFSNSPKKTQNSIDKKEKQKELPSIKINISTHKPPKKNFRKINIHLYKKNINKNGLYTQGKTLSSFDTNYKDMRKSYSLNKKHTTKEKSPILIRELSYNRPNQKKNLTPNHSYYYQHNTNIVPLQRRKIFWHGLQKKKELCDKVYSSSKKFVPHRAKNFHAPSLVSTSEDMSQKLSYTFKRNLTPLKNKTTKLKALNNTLNIKKKLESFNSLNFLDFDNISNDDICEEPTQFTNKKSINLKRNNFLTEVSTTDNNLYLKQGNSKSFSALLSPLTTSSENIKSNSFVQESHLSVKILSMYNTSQMFFSLNKISLYDKNYNEFKINCIMYNSSFIKIPGCISCKYVPNTNLHIYYKKSSNFEDVNYVCFSNGEKNGLKEIEIYKNNSLLLWKGVLPNKTSDYYIKLNHLEIEVFSDCDSDDISLSNNFSRIPKISETSSLLSLINRSKTRVGSTTQINSKKYITCQKIRIQLNQNYGHHSHIGLTGIELISEGFQPIDIESAKSIGALPKGLNDADVHIFENIFNNINQTTDESNMWLTKNKNPYIEICFKQSINLSAIRVWNYNLPENLDKGVKQINLYFDDEIHTDSPIILRKGIGEENIDYCQEIRLPYQPKKFTKEEIKPFTQVKYASMLYNQKFETPYLPCGFIFKFILLGNWGDKEYIGLEDLKLYDQVGKEIKLKKKISPVPEEKRMVYFSAYYNFRKHYEEKNTFSEGFFGNKKKNILYYIYDEVVAISYIRVQNLKKDWMKGVSQMMIECDGKMIFNGEINRYNILNQGYTSILFTCDLNITKDIKESEISGYDTEIKNQIDTLCLGDENRMGRGKIVKDEKSISLILK